jgi:hypothetical protein
VWAHNSHLGDARATEVGEHGEVPDSSQTYCQGLADLPELGLGSGTVGLLEDRAYGGGRHRLGTLGHAGDGSAMAQRWRPA